MTTSLHSRLDPATAPIESTGRERHDVSLLVAVNGRSTDSRFRRIGEHLDTGDVLVVNSSATEPAALWGCFGDTKIGIHVAGPSHDDGRWVIELRKGDRSGPILDARRCNRIDVGDGTLTLIEPAGAAGLGVRLWTAVWAGRRRFTEVVRTSGNPIRYAYVPGRWPIETYRTVFEAPRPEFSSAEMPSAARPFTHGVIGDLRRRGIQIAPITLHTGVSSQEHHERPMPERFEVGRSTAETINRARARGNRIVAVGTTSARALESATDGTHVSPARGWTDLVLSSDRPTTVVDALVTGWHPPEASHLDLLEAVAGREAVSHAYERAHDLGYRSHEFGDSCLLFRDRSEGMR